MAGLSDIEWTDATWNPVAGCLMVSPGCTNCYAMRMAARLQAMNHPNYVGTVRKSGNKPVWTGKVKLIASSLDVPKKWKKPRKIFVNSMSDLFQEGVPEEFIGKVWTTMMAAVGKVKLKKIDWAIVGGESGPAARPMETAWVEEIRQQCEKSSTAFFFKQWGGTNKKATGRQYRGRTWDEYPTAQAPL